MNRASVSNDDLRELRKRLLVAESMLMREKLARDLRDTLRPVRLLQEAVGLASARLSSGSVLWIVIPWLMRRFRGGESGRKPVGQAHRTFNRRTPNE